MGIKDLQVRQTISIFSLKISSLLQFGKAKTTCQARRFGSHPEIGRMHGMAKYKLGQRLSPLGSPGSACRCFTGWTVAWLCSLANQRCGQNGWIFRSSHWKHFPAKASAQQNANCMNAALQTT